MTTSPIDWGKVLHDTEEGTRVIPAGQYLIRITDATATKAGTGAEMIKTTVQLVDGPYAGRQVVTNIVFSFDNPQAMRMVFKRLNALGVTSEWLAESNATVGQIAAAIAGREAIADVSVRQWQGEDRNDIAMFLPGGSGGAITDGPPMGGPSGSMVPDVASLEETSDSSGGGDSELYTMPGQGA